MPTKSQRVNRTLPDKDCLERYTNQKHYLGNINKEWKKVTFIIWSGNKGRSGSIEILNKKGAVVLGINFKKNTVEFKNNHEGKWRNTNFDIDNFLTSGALMNVTIYLNKYSASISLNSKEINKFYNNTFWPSNWWTGRFMMKDKPMLRIKGDFLTVTPVLIDKFNKVNGTKLPYAFKIDEIAANNVSFHFHIILDRKGISVKEKNLTIKFEQGKAYECVIMITKNRTYTVFNIKINGKIYDTEKIETLLQRWMINRIGVRLIFLFEC
uniref:Galectin n=1 Tax=Meloidogyne floridensis TaxID=298350 RepID=A0A915P3F3_9BILA